ncbi:MAG: UvrB/UvrC motif-containing protein [Thermoguttaceae bacterium]|nr:UvrB/UvrC motif-containing protein [Thermoguttaceae bacterium]
MKCQKCGKPATFHFIETIGSQCKEMHFCDDHANEYLHKNHADDNSDNLDNVETASCEYEEEGALKDVTNDLIETDFQTCRYCGFGYHEFRKTGKFGCANDYREFQKTLDDLLIGIHGSDVHRGKRPKRGAVNNVGSDLLRCTTELREAVAAEDYERAAVLRDKINALKSAING